MAAITPEHYNRLVRLLQHGLSPKVTLDIEAETYKNDQMGFNVVGEIPGTTKKDEIVMLGGHLDSWQGGTGATDNGTGSSVAMEAIRILTTLHKPLDRTVRIALWGGEEEGPFDPTRRYLNSVACDAVCPYAPRGNERKISRGTWKIRSRPFDY